MKAQILKIAGVKSEKEFYKKYKTEADFMKVHGKEFKKAQVGASIGQSWGNNSWANSGADNFNSQSAGLSGQPAMGTLTGGTMMSTQQTALQPITSGGSVNTGQQGGGGFDYAKGIPVIGGIINAMGSFEQEKKAKQAANQASQVANISAIASGTQAEKSKRKFVTPWDNVQTGEALSPVLGVGTNAITKNGGSVRKAKNGKPIKGNQTEIQNTYSEGNDIYTDGGYEPLDIPKAQFGAENAGGQLGGAIGGAFGPVWGTMGAMVGNMFDENPAEIAKYNRQTKKSMDTMFGNQFGAASRAGHSGFMKDGGYLNPEYNPQVITMFGDHTAEDFADYAHKDQYRAGGHLQSYTPPSERAMETYANGGDVGTDQVGDVSIESGGYLKPVAWNPHTGGTGFTSKFYGQSHVEQAPGLDHTGIIMKYGGNPNEQNGDHQMAEGGDAEGTTIEAERGEYISERKDGGQAGKSAQISGNRTYNSNFYDLGPAFTKEFEGMKIKNIQGKVAADDAKLNKFDDKNTQELLAYTPITQIDKLKQNSLIANQKGINMKYGINAAKVNSALAWQNSANEVIDEQNDIYGKEINGDDFIKSGGTKIKYGKESLDSSISKNGGKYAKAQQGTSRYDLTPWQGNVSKGNKYGKATASGFSTQQWDEVADKLGFKGKGNKEFQEFLLQNKESAPLIKARHQNLYGKDPWVDPEHFGYGWAANELLLPKAAEIPADTTTIQQTTLPLEAVQPEEKRDFPWMSLVNQFMPKPSDVEALDYAQLYPEMYAMASNQLEPVPAQGYQPEVGTPYDISLQDQLDANQADFRSMQRQTSGNPAAQANLAAQKYAANSKVLGEQFRLNQAEKAGVYGRNRDILNQSKLQNLGIFDKQYERQALAQANTKATTQAALNSMSDKVAKNKLEGRTLQTYENLYNYRFDPGFKAQNYNPLAQFDTSVKGAAGRKSSEAHEGYEYETILKKKKKEKDVAKNGSIVKSYKNI